MSLALLNRLGQEVEPPIIIAVPVFDKHLDEAALRRKRHELTGQIVGDIVANLARIQNTVGEHPVFIRIHAKKRRLELFALIVEQLDAILFLLERTRGSASKFDFAVIHERRRIRNLVVIVRIIYQSEGHGDPGVGHIRIPVLPLLPVTDHLVNILRLFSVHVQNDNGQMCLKGSDIDAAIPRHTIRSQTAVRVLMYLMLITAIVHRECRF